MYIIPGQMKALWIWFWLRAFVLNAQVVCVFVCVHGPGECPGNLLRREDVVKGKCPGAGSVVGGQVSVCVSRKGSKHR